MERENKEVHAHYGVDLAALLLRVKNRVGNWYKRAKGATNIAPIDIKMVLFNSLGDDTRVRIEIWTSTTRTTLKLCHQLGAITERWEREFAVFIGVPGTTKKKLNNVHEEFEAALKAKKRPMAKYKWMIWNRYVGRILDTRFEVTKFRLNFVSFDMEMEIKSQDVEVVVPFSFDEDICNKIRTNDYNKVGRSGGDPIKEEEKGLTGREDKENSKNSLRSNDKVESGVYVPSRPPKKVKTTTKMTQASTTTYDNTTQTITNLSNNGKVPNIGSVIKEYEVTGVWLLRDGKHQVTTSARKEDGTDSDK